MSGPAIADFSEPLSPSAAAAVRPEAQGELSEKLKELANIVLRLERDEERLTALASDLENQRKTLDTIHKTIIVAIITLVAAVLSLAYQSFKAVPDLKVDYARERQATQDAVAAFQGDVRSLDAKVAEVSDRLWDLARGSSIAKAR